MCFYSQISQDALRISNRFKAKFVDDVEYTPKAIINAFEYPINPVITNEKPSLIQYYNWGIIPEGVNDLNIRKFTLNARIETVAAVKSFKNIITNRCLVIADGFFEWKHLNLNGKVIKERYLITLPNTELFSFAGLYSSWENSQGNKFKTYTILTTQANELMADIHNTKKRMPVILSKDDELKWLNGFNVGFFAFPYEQNLIAVKK